MPELSTIAKLFQDFIFIADIKEIYDDFLSLQTTTQAIGLRRKLQSLKEKAYYPQLNTLKIDNAIYQAQIYLAEQYPLNDEDPITLDEFKDNKAITISTGHRFQIEPLRKLIKRQSLFKVRNPITNLQINHSDMLRVIQAIESEYPNDFKSMKSYKDKTLLLQMEKKKESYSKFQEKPEEEQIKMLEFDFNLERSIQPIINTALLHFLVMNYFIFTKHAELSKLPGEEAYKFILSNILGILSIHFLFKLSHDDKELYLPHLGSSITDSLKLSLPLIAFDFILSLTLPKDRAQPNFLSRYHPLIFACGFSLISLQIKYPFNIKDVNYFKAYTSLLVSFFIFSNIFKYFLFDNSSFKENKSEIDRVQIANNFLYIPISFLIYNYISESGKLIAQLSKYLNKDEQYHEIDDDIGRYNPFIINPFDH